MNRLVRAELLKLRTTRTTVVLVLAGLGFAALLGFANAAIAGDPGAPELGSAAFVEDVLGVSAVPAGVALLLGVLLSAGEHQHGTITSTFLATPRRERVVGAKAAAAAIAGVVLAVAMIVTAVAAAAPALIAEGVAVDAFHRGAALTLLGLLLASALLGALGMLLGFLVRSQVAAVVVVIAWFTVLEGIVDVLTGGGLRRWLPGGAAANLAGNGGQPLWAAALILSGWTAAAAAISTPVVVRRDVA
jgi:ABC-2 type transport system permease protein